MNDRSPRPHPELDSIPTMATEALWSYIAGEVEYLASPDQRRAPSALAAAVDEVRIRHQASRAYA